MPGMRGFFVCDIFSLTKLRRHDISISHCKRYRFLPTLLREVDGMARKIPKDISVLEFVCQAPLRFFEHCARCPRFGDDCPDLTLGKEVLSGRKRIEYRYQRGKDTIPVSAFNCLAPLYYFERSRKKCGHAGRCREEGLLLALLNGKKTLDYSHKEATELPRVRRLRKVARRVPRPSQKVSVP